VVIHPEPLSAFTYSPTLPVERVAACFAATSFLSDPSTMISSYQWSFGDGATGSGATVSHTYSHEGTYTVTLTVTDGLGLTSSTTERMTVADAPPIAAISVLPRHPAPGHAVHFSGWPSHDADDPLVSYLWHIAGAGSVGRSVTHTFARSGTYLVSLTVRDSFGQIATTTVRVLVRRSLHLAKSRGSSHRRRR
jgi:PKD repeat protein